MINSCAIDYSRGIVLYRGYNLSPFPTWDYAAIEKEFGIIIAKEVLRYINEISLEIGNMNIDWGKSSSSACAVIYREMSDRHPELTEEALQAIIWNSSYNNR